MNSKNYVFGDQDVQVPAHLNFGKFILDRLRNQVEKDDEAIALVNTKTGEDLSYKELLQKSINVAVKLITLGVKKTDTVAFGSEKRNDFIPTVLGVIFTGATFTPIDLYCGRSVLRHKISITKPKYIMVTKQFWDLNSDVLLECDFVKSFITLDNGLENFPSLENLIDEDVKLFEPVEVSGQCDTAFVLYSSGTTGMPKGVQLTHLNCILNSLPWNNESLKTIWIHAEWYHNYDAFMTFKFLVCGKKIIYHPEYTNEILLRNLSEYKANMAMLVPSSFAFLAKTDLLNKYTVNSVQVLYSRSSPLHVRTVEQVMNRFPNLKNVYQGYGMTESGELTSEMLGPKGSKPGSVGIPTPGIILKVVDLNTKEALGPNQHGEICLKGPVLMKGYIGTDPASYMDDVGFLRTGDLGYYDEDFYFYIVDRLKEIIVYDGYKVAPLELETLLLLHPGVKEAGVVGKPDDAMGELPTAFVVRQPGYTVTEGELLDFVSSEVSHYMQLRGGIRFIEKIPRNPRGKILKNQLRNMLKHSHD